MAPLLIDMFPKDAFILSWHSPSINETLCQVCVSGNGSQTNDDSLVMDTNYAAVLGVKEGQSLTLKRAAGEDIGLSTAASVVLQPFSADDWELTVILFSRIISRRYTLPG